ncbi:MAG: ABC transporter ATP-binding protein [Proteobacteria bacterium]|nr:ABC transporter ATP-binding protein [Pseudomonadota bacterium]
MPVKKAKQLAGEVLLQVEGLQVEVAGKALVRGVDVQVAKGEVVALVGESGSGKTLTALAVMGLLAPELAVRAKSMIFDGQELQSLPAEARRLLRGKRMAMVFQEPATALNPVLRCGYQVEEALMIHTRLGRKARRERVLELFAQVQLPEPERIFVSYPHEISGGQRQRVMIAMALANNPDLLVADEPTTALDVTVQAEILALMQDLQKRLGMAMLWITHDFGVVRKLADRVVVLRDGKVVEQGVVADVLASPKAAYTKDLLAATLVMKRGQKVRGKGKGKVAKSPPLLAVAGVQQVYRQGGWWWGGKPLVALDEVGFELSAGGVLGVVGESGSGKSTLAKVLTRLVAPQAGRVVFMGRDFLALRGEELRLARREMQMVFQDPVTSLSPKLPIGESIAEGVRAHGTMAEREIAGYVAKLLKEVGLPVDCAGRLPHQFSGGQRQRIAIARALALQPKLLIADEPVSALDVQVQAQVLELLAKIRRERGMAMVFISHDLRVVSHVADEVLVMHQGKIVERGPVAAVFGAPAHDYTRRLVGAVV